MVTADGCLVLVDFGEAIQFPEVAGQVQWTYTIAPHEPLQGNQMQRAPEIVDGIKAATIAGGADVNFEHQPPYFYGYLGLSN